MDYEELKLLEDKIYMHNINKNTYVLEDVTDYIMEKGMNSG